MGAGMVAHLNKPFTLDDLKKIVDLYSRNN
jgi:hypothetical protein